MTITWDVDGTLITYEDKPRYDIINLYRWFQAQGCTMIIASGGGADYARMWGEKLGLKAHKYLAKSPDLEKYCDLSFDDEFVKLAKVNIRVKNYLRDPH